MQNVAYISKANCSQVHTPFGIGYTLLFSHASGTGNCD